MFKNLHSLAIATFCCTLAFHSGPVRSETDSSEFFHSASGNPVNDFILKDLKKIEVTLVLDDHFYLYKDKFSVLDDTGAAVAFKFINAPRPTLFHSKEVFTNGVTIQVDRLNVQKSQSLTITYQGCGDDICLLPQKIAVDLN